MHMLRLHSILLLEVSAGTQLLKLSEENEWLKSNMINMKEIMSDYERELRELKEELKSTVEDKKLIIEKK